MVVQRFVVPACGVYDELQLRRRCPPGNLFGTVA
jgi:hypothetical protein